MILGNYENLKPFFTVFAHDIQYYKKQGIFSNKFVTKAVKHIVENIISLQKFPENILHSC